MRITDRLWLDVVEGRGLALVEVRDIGSAEREIVMTPQEAGRLVAGIEWFATHGRDSLRIPLREAIEDAVVLNNRASS